MATMRSAWCASARAKAWTRGRTVVLKIKTADSKSAPRRVFARRTDTACLTVSSESAREACAAKPTAHPTACSRGAMHKLCAASECDPDGLVDRARAKRAKPSTRPGQVLRERLRPDDCGAKGRGLLGWPSTTPSVLLRYRLVLHPFLLNTDWRA